MKKLCMALAAMVAVAVWATAPFTDTIGTDSVQLVAKKPVSWTAWTTNTAYAQGAVVKSSGYYYFIANAGLSTNAAPSHSTGEQTLGAITYRQISPNRRQGVLVSVQTASADGGAVNLSFGTSDATNSAGLILVGQGSTVTFSPTDNYQGEIHAISQTGSNVVVGVQEF